MAPSNNETRRRFRPASFRAEPAIALALQHLTNGAAANDALQTALDALHLLGPSSRDEHAFPSALKPLERQLSSDSVQFHVTGEATCRVDINGVTAVIRTAMENAALSGDAALLVEIDAENEPPTIDLIFDGPGAIPDAWFIGSVVPVSFEEMKLHWTRHTGGARVDRSENGITFKLVGQREPEPNPKGDEAVAAALDAAVKAADATTVQAVLEAIDNRSPGPEPSDVASLLRELAGEGRGTDLQCGDSLPPIAMRRDRIAVSLERLCDLAQPRIDAGASITIVAEYNATECAVEIECAFPRSNQDRAWQAACAALERVVVVLHRGVCIVDLAEDSCNVSLAIPDSIGAEINEWIPGFGAFSERSIQMLRLLKSGGQAPPEDLILGGVLESELERWLMPVLEAAPAVNVAHEREKGKNPPRLAKALGQIRRAKPKKEICAPAYAAEIIEAYSSDERGRGAIGLHVFDSGEIDALVNGLKSEPMEYVTCLRLLAKITRAASA